MRIEEKVFGKVNGVKIFEDASDLDIGKGKRFRGVLHAASLVDQLIKGLAAEIDDASVRKYGSCMDIDDVALLLDERYFDIAILPALFSQDFDSQVNVLMSGEPSIVAVNLAEENDGGSAWSQWLAGHLKFIRRNRLEIHRPCKCCEEVSKKKGTE